MSHGPATLHQGPVGSTAVPVTLWTELFIHGTNSSKGPLSNSMEPFGRGEANRPDTKSRKYKNPCSRGSAPSGKGKEITRGTQNYLIQKATGVVPNRKIPTQQRKASAFISTTAPHTHGYACVHTHTCVHTPCTPRIQKQL